MDRNWADMGLSWASEDVRETVSTGNAAQKRVVGQAQIAIVEDLDKFRKHFTDAVVLGIMDGTSVRVTSQNVARPMLANGKKPTVEALREAVYNRLQGIRVVSRVATTVEVKSYILPDGSKYSGTDLAEYQQAFVAAMVDLGVDAPLAIASAQKLAL